MTTPMPAAGEPVRVELPAPTEAIAQPDDAADRRSVRILWWKTIVVVAFAFLATVAVLLWQWLGPASGTVTR